MQLIGLIMIRTPPSTSISSNVSKSLKLVFIGNIIPVMSWRFELYKARDRIFFINDCNLVYRNFDSSCFTTILYTRAVQVVNNTWALKLFSYIFMFSGRKQRDI